MSADLHPALNRANEQAAKIVRDAYFAGAARQYTMVPILREQNARLQDRIGLQAQVIRGCHAQVADLEMRLADATVAIRHLAANIGDAGAPSARRDEPGRNDL